MQLGSFLKLPATMLIMLFDDKPELLQNYLSSASSDVQKEFAYLLRVVSACEYQLPEYQCVSDNYSEFTSVVDGCIAGADPTTSALLIAEIRMKVVEKVFKQVKRGKFKKVPDDLLSLIKKDVSGTFEMGDLRKIVNRIFSDLEDSVVDESEEWAKSFGLKKVCPSKLVIDSKVIVLDDEQKALFNYFSNKKDLIKECIKSCSSGVVDDDVIFGIAAFDLVSRKPTSIRYIVQNYFDLIKDKRDSAYLLNLIENCKHEMKNLDKFFSEIVVQSDSVASKEALTLTDVNTVLKGVNSECRDYFLQAFDNHSLELSDLSKDSLDMLIDLFQRTQAFCKEDVERLIGIRIKDWKTFVSSACDICIYGLNDCSFDLFKIAVKNTILETNSMMLKSAEEMQQWRICMRDVNALLKTLGPIGEIIEGS